MYILYVHNYQNMSTSIAQSRQQFAALVVAAQVTPQVITKRNTPVAVIVSANYFETTLALSLADQATRNLSLADQATRQIRQPTASFYDKLMALRDAQMPLDEEGLCLPNRMQNWTRWDAFGDSR